MGDTSFSQTQMKFHCNLQEIHVSAHVKHMHFGQILGNQLDIFRLVQYLFLNEKEIGLETEMNVHFIYWPDRF